MILLLKIGDSPRFLACFLVHCAIKRSNKHFPNGADLGFALEIAHSVANVNVPNSEVKLRAIPKLIPGFRSPWPILGDRINHGWQYCYGAHPQVQD